ncbi:MAG: hypothetical protein GX267_01140 [Fibrobacter sp.]|jgi:methyl-accepting chemotaxis protein|nr:hypothetical protein [Fibrobacter sp.]
MTEKNFRHPLRNFFIKRTVQIKIVMQIILTTLIAGAITLSILILIYNSKAHAGSFYYMSNDVMQDLELKNILGIILTPIITVEFVAILVSFVIGLFSSRKVAVPIYKIEKWAADLSKGKLNTELSFREEDHLTDFSEKCNAATEFYRKNLTKINLLAENISRNPSDPSLVYKDISAIREILGKIDF